MKKSNWRWVANPLTPKKDPNYAVDLRLWGFPTLVCPSYEKIWWTYFWRSDVVLKNGLVGVDSAQILRASNFTFPFCIQCFKQTTLYTATGPFKPSISNCRCILRKSDLGKKFLASCMFLSKWAYNPHLQASPETDHSGEMGRDP